MVDGRTQLTDWIARRQVNQREAARLLGIDFTTLNHLLTGRRGVGLAVAVNLERRTGIPVEAWLPTHDGNSETSVSVVARKR